MKNSIFNFFLLIFIAVILSTCEDKKNLDAEALILDWYKSSAAHGSAHVTYKIVNMCIEDIEGWNIFFRVTLANSYQIEAKDGITYLLNPGDTSLVLTASGTIPQQFTVNNEPINATLRRIELY